MTWPNFLAPAWGWLGLLAVPMVLLYLLRQKRPDQPISSTLLWSKTLADLRASTPFQKLRRNLLLLLQLLILAALVFTLMRPVIQAQARQTRAGVIVIDATASMQSRDGGADESRIDRAKAEASRLVDTMRPGDQYMLIADGGGMNQVRSGFSSSKAELHGFIESIHASDTASDLSESLLLAATSLRAIGANAASPSSPAGTEAADADAAGAPRSAGVQAGKIWLFSDGAGVKVPDAMGENNQLLQFVRVGSSDHSVGITRLSITPVPKEPRTYQVFVGLKNAWTTGKRVGVLLAFGSKDEFLPGQAKFADLPPATVGGGAGSVVFEKVVSDPGKLFVRVDDKEDDFPLDNTAYGIIAAQRKVRAVLVTEGNLFLENLINTAVKVGAIEGQIVAPQAYNPQADADLFIFDSYVPPADKLPHADTLFMRPVMSSNPGAAAGGTADIAGFKVANVIENPTILRWRREDPLMQSVDLSDVRISRSLLMDRDPSAVELASAPEGPLIAYKDFGPVRRYFVGFSPLLESNWSQIPSMIIFMQNAIDQTRIRHFIGMPELVAAGNPAKLWDVGDDKGEGAVRIALPDGASEQVAAKDGTAEFGATDKLGFYEVAGSAGKKSIFAVNLLSPAESDIRPQSLQTTGGGNVEESASVASVNKEVWRWLAAGALAVLLLEWWVYNRRIA
jgi:hypothetical protein